MNVALYIRVSKDEQHPENQEIALREFCQRQGHEIVKVYIDHGVSGAKMIRKGLGEMLAHAQLGHFQGIVIWKFDRLGRNLAGLLALVDELRKMNIELISITENIDTSTPGGNLIFQVFGALAEFEREIITERINAGLNRARKEGKLLGRDIGAERKQKILETYLETGVLRETARRTGEAYSTVRLIVGLSLQEEENSKEKV